MARPEVYIFVVCSTPVGIKARETYHRLLDRVAEVECSTPVGIKARETRVRFRLHGTHGDVLNACRHQGEGDSAMYPSIMRTWKCSTPVGIKARETPAIQAA